MQTHPIVPSLIWSSCSSDRRFAARFLQIPRHHGHPCVKLTVTSAFTVRDLHPIDYAHAGRTIKKVLPILRKTFFQTYFLSDVISGTCARNYSGNSLQYYINMTWIRYLLQYLIFFAFLYNRVNCLLHRYPKIKILGTKKDDLIWTEPQMVDTFKKVTPFGVFSV